MRRQVVPDPVEFLDFHIHLKQRCNELENAICSGEYQPRRAIRLTSEKSRGLCRQMVLPSPEDALVLQALSNSLWDVIKNKAPHHNSFYAPQDQPFSKKNKLEEDGDFGYGPIEAWLDFQTEILKFSKNRKFVVVTDIANYYDSILHNFLRSILSEYAQERESALDLLLYILDGMLWRPDYMPNYGIGLPQMDQDAPRLLAHTHLFEIDELFGADKTIDFARYMDDIDFGVDSIAKAKSVLRDLDLALQTRNLRLNSGKTKILTSDEAAVHFRAADNDLVDRLEQRIASSGYLENRIAVFRRLISRAISTGLATGRFAGGNGTKILKRLLRNAARTGAPLAKDSVRAILYNEPGLRPLLLYLWSLSDRPHDGLSIVSGFLRSGESIDDVSKVAIINACVSACWQQPMGAADYSFLLSSLDQFKPFELFSKMWLVSRFGTIDGLHALISATNAVWSRHLFLARTVAGFYGLFRGTPLFPAYEAFTRKWGGPEAIALMDFQESVATTSAGYHGILGFVKADNQSQALLSTHSKTLMMATMFSNGQISKLDKAKLLGIRKRIMDDHYYRARFAGIMSGLP